jgi:ABC-type branched-subunit amino acid transport system ATPase component
MAEIVLDRVSKVYSGGVKGVDDLSLEISDGEFMVLVGPSGCGKSTATAGWRSATRSHPAGDRPRSAGLADQRPGDDEPLDLVRAFDDLQHFGLAQVALGGEILHVPVAAEDLHRIGRHPHGGVAG